MIHTPNRWQAFRRAGGGSDGVEVVSGWSDGQTGQGRGCLWLDWLWAVALRSLLKLYPIYAILLSGKISLPYIAVHTVLLHTCLGIWPDTDTRPVMLPQFPSASSFTRSEIGWKSTSTWTNRGDRHREVKMQGWTHTVISKQQSIEDKLTFSAQTSVLLYCVGTKEATRGCNWRVDGLCTIPLGRDTCYFQLGTTETSVTDTVSIV